MVPSQVSRAGAAESATGVVLTRVREGREARAIMRAIVSANEALYVEFALAGLVHTLGGDYGEETERGVKRGR
eukprot:6460651-Alexandrium_andersonii.AAC.1